MIELKKDGKVFMIPVYWEVVDLVEVKADSLKEAYDYVVDNADDIPFGTEPRYVDDSYKVDSFEMAQVLNGEEQ